MKRKIYISFDFEGLGGVTNWKETFDNERFNRLATEQINVFVEGILEKHPDAVIVLCDSHSKGQNIIWEQLNPAIILIKGYPRVYYMVEGLDETFTDFVLFGYHSPIGKKGNMDHSYSASSIHNITVNGKTVGEAEINTLVASYYNVPLRFFYADSDAVAWMNNTTSDRIDYLVSKYPISRFSAGLIPYEKNLNNLRDAGKTFTESPGFLYSEAESYKMTIELADTAIAYACHVIPGIEVVDPRTISVTADNPLIMYKYLMTVLSCSIAAKHF